MIKIINKLKWRVKKRERATVIYHYIQLERILFPMCDEFVPAAYGEACDEILAKEILRDFFAVLCAAAPDKELEMPRDNYYSFLLNMIPMRNALKQKKYALACHELATLFHYEAVLQERIYYNLIDLYQKYVEEK